MNRTKKILIGIILASALVMTSLLGSEFIKKEDTRPSDGAPFSQSEKEGMRSKYIDESFELVSSGDTHWLGIPVKKTVFHDEDGKEIIIKETPEGEIIFYFSFGKSKKQATKNLTEEEALKIVKEELEVPEDYVLSLTENKNNEYHFWFNRVVEGIVLRCDGVSARISKGTGEISSWSKRYYEELPDLTPTLSEEEALRIANEKFDGGAEIKELIVERCLVNPSAPPSIDSPTKPCLLWFIVDTDSELYNYMFLDAHTGERIS